LSILQLWEEGAVEALFMWLWIWSLRSDNIHCNSEQSISPNHKKNSRRVPYKLWRQRGSWKVKARKLVQSSSYTVARASCRHCRGESACEQRSATRTTWRKRRSRWLIKSGQTEVSTQGDLLTQNCSNPVTSFMHRKEHFVLPAYAQQSIFYVLRTSPSFRRHRIDGPGPADLAVYVVSHIGVLQQVCFRGKVGITSISLCSLGAEDGRHAGREQGRSSCQRKFERGM